MFIQELASKGIRDERVLQAMAHVPRHEFLPEELRPRAYEEVALPIGCEQTISQPYIVAFMTEKLHLTPTDKVLEIGTGSGYQAAVLASLVEKVYSVEIVAPLAQTARKTLTRLGYHNIQIQVGDGHQGWPEHAPYDAIIVTCATQKIPKPLLAQLKNGGRMILPLGEPCHQDLCLVEKQKHALKRSYILPVQFVPMTGKEKDSPPTRQDTDDF